MKNWLGNLWLLVKRFFTRDPGGMGESPAIRVIPNRPEDAEPAKIATALLSTGLTGLVQNSVAIQHGLCDLCRTMQPIREYRGHFYCDYCGELWRQTYQDEHAS